MSVAWLCVLALGLAALMNFAIHRDVLYPPVLQNAMWGLIVLLFATWSDVFATLSLESAIIIMTASLVFSAGGYAATVGMKAQRALAPPTLTRVDRWFVYGASLIAAAGLPFFLLRAAHLAEGGITDNPFINIRYELTQGGENYGLFAYLIPISVFASALTAVFARSLPRAAIVFVFIVMGSYAALWTGRTVAFNVILLVLSILVLQGRIGALKAGLISIAVGLLLFGTVGVVLGKGGNLDSDLVSNVASILESLRDYALSPLAAFQQVLQNDPPLSWGANTFRTYFAALSAIGIDGLEVVPLVKEFTFVPVPVNVYTVFHPYYVDFGIAGILVTFTVIGFLHSYVYRKGSEGDPVWIVLSGLMTFPLFMQFFQDQYFSLASTWTQYLSLLTVYGACRAMYRRRGGTYERRVLSIRPEPIH